MNISLVNTIIAAVIIFLYFCNLKAEYTRIRTVFRVQQKDEIALHENCLTISRTGMFNLLVCTNAEWNFKNILEFFSFLKQFMNKSVLKLKCSSFFKNMCSYIF